MEERFSFTPGHPLLTATRVTLERHGFTCRVETSTVAGFSLETLVAVAKEKPNRETRGCTL